MRYHHQRIKMIIANNTSNLLWIMLELAAIFRNIIKNVRIVKGYRNNRA
ncbi:MAG: hypothetical protein QM204_01725 [Bacillota bacterium]|nr:hypothetical protein [Bacillota bacterium]NLL26569.1 hypothetical protein [Erysipelotrichia bacterium]